MPPSSPASAPVRTRTQRPARPARRGRPARPYATVGPVGLVLLALLAGLLVGCTGDDEQEQDRPSTGGGRAGGSSVPDGLSRTKVGVGQVVGRLPAQQRARVRTDVRSAVDRWWKASWLRVDYPTKTVRDPFPGFTDAAARLARGDQRTMTAARFSRRVTGVVPVRRDVTVDVLAPGGRPAAATARFRLALVTQAPQDRGTAGRVVVSGRLFLTPAGKRWRVFGFDVADDVPRALLPAKARAAAKQRQRAKQREQQRERQRAREKKAEKSAKKPAKKSARTKARKGERR